MKRFISGGIIALCYLLGQGIFNLATALDTSSQDLSLKYSSDLKSISNSFQIAKATFLPDYGESSFSGYKTIGDDYNIQNCESYPHSSCPTGANCEACPFNIKKYKVLSCTAPYIKSGDTCACPAATPVTYPNDVCTKYCGNTCIAKTCTPTPNKTICTNKFRDCDNGCGQNTRKCCNPCTNKVTSKPEHSSYTYSSCTDDDGSKQIQNGWKCDTGYHEKNGECEKDCISNNCSGYPLSSCPTNANCSKCTITATNCSTDGTKYKIDSCKAGPVTSCSGYTLSSCPANANCSSCSIVNSDCSSGGTKYKMTSCKSGPANSCSGYTLSACPANGNCSYCNIVNSDCSSGGTKYKLVSCKSGYTLSGNSCVQSSGSTCSIGYILFSDKTCAPDLISGKTPIGVVFNINPNLAVALVQGEGLSWSPENMDIPNLMNYTTSDAAKQSFDGNYYTALIRAHGDSNGYATDAADYCYNYSTSGAYQGSWFLPSGGELQALYTNKTIVNATLSKIGAEKILDRGHWSSAEYNNTNVWVLNMSNGSWTLSNKYLVNFARPVISFEIKKACTANSCSSYTLSACPTNGYCKSCKVVNSDCSSGATKYSLVSCQNGTMMSGNKCVTCGITQCEAACMSKQSIDLSTCQRECRANPCAYVM